MKRLIYIILLIVIIAPLISAGSIGITPTKFKYFFEPGLEKEITFRIISGEENQSITSYVKGDLAEYVTLSETSFIGSGYFTAKIKLPEKIEKPGSHFIYIGAIEDVNKEGDSAVAGVAAIQSLIEIVVPYPGKYIEAKFEVSDINEGENPEFFLEINNLGSENIDVRQKINIYGENNSLILTREIPVQHIISKDSLEIIETIDGSFKAGSYDAILEINYGGNELMELNDTFRVGHFSVDILDYSHIFEVGKINPFHISVGNVWNKKMENVYAEVSITDQGSVIDKFKTPSINMEPWEVTNLTGFFDATNVSIGKYTANIKVFFEYESNHKLVAIYVVEGEKDNIWLIAGAIAGGFLLIVIIVFIYLILKIRKLKKNVQKKK